MRERAHQEGVGLLQDLIEGRRRGGHHGCRRRNQGIRRAVGGGRKAQSRHPLPNSRGGMFGRSDDGLIGVAGSNRPDERVLAVAAREPRSTRQGPPGHPASAGQQRLSERAEPAHRPCRWPASPQRCPAPRRCGRRWSMCGHRQSCSAPPPGRRHRRRRSPMTRWQNPRAISRRRSADQVEPRHHPSFPRTLTSRLSKAREKTRPPAMIPRLTGTPSLIPPAGHTRCPVWSPPPPPHPVLLPALRRNRCACRNPW